MKKVVQNAERAKAIAQARRSRGCAAKRRTAASGWRTGAGPRPARIGPPSDSRSTQKSATSSATAARLSAAGAQRPTDCMSRTPI